MVRSSSSLPEKFSLNEIKSCWSSEAGESGIRTGDTFSWKRPELDAVSCQFSWTFSSVSSYFTFTTSYDPLNDGAAFHLHCH